jgi:hypothetical protein
VCAQYFFYYGATIFQSVGIDDSFVTQIILGAINVSFVTSWYGGVMFLLTDEASGNLCTPSSLCAL